MSFDSFAYYEVIADIEEYLGYLKGNELAFEYLHQALIASTGTAPTEDERIMTVFLDDDYRFPCPEGRFAVKPSRVIVKFDVHVPADLSDPPDLTPAAWLKQVQEGASQSFQNGLSWSQGLAGYATSITDQITKPDAVALDAAARRLKTNVVDELVATGGDDWAGIEGYLSSWHGAAKAQFDPFYRNVSGLLETYSTFSAYAYAGLCVATEIVAHTQNGLMKYVETLRQQCVDQLDAWVDRGQPPEDTPKTPSWVADVTKIAGHAYGLLDHVPVVSIVKGQVDKAISIKDSITDIAVDLGAEPPKKEPPFDAKTAQEIYHSFTTTLSDDYLKKYQDAMDDKLHGTLAPGRELDGKTPFSGDAALQLLEKRMSFYGWNLAPVGTGSLYSPGSEYQF